MRSKHTLAAVVTTIGSLALPGAGGAEEFGYRDLAPARRNAPAVDAPLIPQAARGPVLARAAQPSPARGDSDLMPLALASGSEAARIFQRHNKRVGRISSLFGKLKTAAREEELAVEKAAENRRRASEARARREAELRRQQEIEEARIAAEQRRITEERQARADAERRRREEEARRRIEQRASAPSRSSTPTRSAPTRSAPTRSASASSPSKPTGPARIGSEYTVQPGDSLIKIARDAYGDPKGWTKIMEANGLTRESTIRVGEVIKIPSYTARAPRGRTARLAHNAASEPRLDYSKYEYKLYNVQPGDTLGHIAARFYSDVGQEALIRKYNQKALAAGLKAGEKILVPLPRSQAHDDRYEQAKRGVF